MSTIDSLGASMVNALAGKSKTTETPNNASKYGNVVGNPQLSDSAAEYYESLKSKYSNLEFVLVDNNSVDTAEQQAAKYMSSGKTVVLLDAAKIEKMASDTAYREKYETLIEDGVKQLDQMSEQMKASGANVKGYGIRINDDGTYTMFAVLEKAAAQQKERIAKEQEARAEERKEQSRERAEKFRDKLNNDLSERSEELKSLGTDRDVTKYDIVSASNLEELADRIADYAQNQRLNHVQTPEETYMGQSIDFKL